MFIAVAAATIILAAAIAGAVAWVATRLDGLERAFGATATIIESWEKRRQQEEAEITQLIERARAEQEEAQKRASAALSDALANWGRKNGRAN